MRAGLRVTKRKDHIIILLYKITQYVGTYWLYDTMTL